MVFRKDRILPSVETYSLFDLQAYIKRVLALNFPDPLWVRAEISQIGRSRGHAYLDLVEKSAEDDRIVAQASAVGWASRLRRLRRRYGEQLDALLQPGVEVRLQVEVVFHERYGLSLHLADIDPAFTMGQVELRRRKILETLQAEHLLSRNGQLGLPPVLQRIAVLSSEQAAGWHDFRAHLHANPWGYAFQLRLFPTALQGDRVESDMSRQLQAIRDRSGHFDAVVLLRGGGARLDLAAFDSLLLGRAVANLPLPLLTGIGHEIDLTVLDRVAHTALKTPTAVADYLLAHNARFEETLHQLARTASRQSTQRINQAALEVHHLRHRLETAARHGLIGEAARLEQLADALPAALRHLFEGQRARLDQWDVLLRERDPAHILRQGFSLTRQGGRVLTSARQVQDDQPLRTQFWDGEIDSNPIS